MDDRTYLATSKLIKWYTSTLMTVKPTKTPASSELGATRLSLQTSLHFLRNVETFDACAVWDFMLVAQRAFPAVFLTFATLTQRAPVLTALHAF